MLREIRSYSMMTGVLFAVTTFASSVMQLLQGRTTDSNTHILLRAAICCLGAGFFYLFKQIKLQNKVLQELVHYLVSLVLILLLVYCLGFFVEIGEKPPYPRFALNYTGVYILTAAVITFGQRKKKKTHEKVQ